MALRPTLLVPLLFSLACLALGAEVDHNVDVHHGMPDVLVYDSETFDMRVPLGPHFVMFYAPWCGHCRRLAPTFNQLSQEYNTNERQPPVTFVKVDCTVHTKLCANHDVKGFPTLLLFTGGSSTNGTKYFGQRDLYNLTEFVSHKTAGASPQSPINLHAVRTLELNADRFKSTIEQNQHFVFFYSPTCSHCQQLNPIWQQLATQNGDRPDLVFAKVNCQQNQELCTQQNIVKFPTLVFYSKGRRVDEYTGATELGELTKYVTFLKTLDKNMDFNVPMEAVLELTAANYDQHINTEYLFVDFYKPWCQHCRALAPVWSSLAAKHSSHGRCVLAAVNCAISSDLCDKHEVTGYPTLILFSQGQKKSMYTGLHQLEPLDAFIMENIGHKEL